MTMFHVFDSLLSKFVTVQEYIYIGNLFFKLITVTIYFHLSFQPLYFDVPVFSQFTWFNWIIEVTEIDSEVWHEIIHHVN